MFVRLGISLLVAGQASPVIGDTLDWINPIWLSTSQARSDPTMVAARKQIISTANSRGTNPPWSVINSTILPPSGNPKDYLSWAPYHWLNCNWCSTHRQALFIGPTLDDDFVQTFKPSSGAEESFLAMNVDDEDAADSRNVNKLNALVRTGLNAQPSSTRTMAYPTTSPPISATPTGFGTKTRDTSPPQEAEKSSKTSQNCTPSPTTLIAPSATWTTCPYIGKDGDRNPDVDDIPDATVLNEMPLGILYNTMAYALVDSAGPASTAGMNAAPSDFYAQTATKFIDTWFVNSVTAMNSNLQYGQLIRGPGKQVGQFMGILDARGFVQVWNSVAILRARKSPMWTTQRDSALVAWANQYMNWLVSSDLGQKAASSPNNHGTFWMAQVAALKYLSGYYPGVRSTINYFVTHQCQDQIAASGEQPFEAVRTRPFHYRCFNLEALITLAKIGDQVGINMWASRSRYGANIQDALQFVMQEIPGDESIQSLLPHVAAVAVAYGDPKKAYAKFIADRDDGAPHRTWFWRDVPGAFGPNNKLPHQRRDDENDCDECEPRVNGIACTCNAKMRRYDEFPTANATGIAWSPGEEPIRPDLFGLNGDDKIELDDGVFVTWEDIRPYYLTLKPSGSDKNATYWANTVVKHGSKRHGPVRIPHW